MPASLPARLKGASVGPLRSKRGCKTCRIRKVKCGEEKPQCIRCSSTGRKCEYEQKFIAGTFSSAPSMISILDRPLSSSSNTVWRERRAFAYYFQHAAHMVGGDLDNEFWATLVPQVCQSEPAVWDAIISIGALFESPEPCPDLVLRRPDEACKLNQNHRDALGWYSRAVSAVRRRIESGSMDTFVGLISCVLFICIEAIQGGVEEALQLYHQGVHLILALRAQLASGAIQPSWSYLLEDVIVPIFVRLGASTFSMSGVSVGHLLPDDKHTPMCGFTSLKSAREAIVLLAIEVQIFQNSYGRMRSTQHVSQEWLDQQASLAARLQSWHADFTDLMDSLHTRENVSSQQIATMALLLSYYEALFITVGTGLSLLETAMDAYIPNFQNIVDQSRIALEAADNIQPLFTFDINIGFALWFTCFRCREPEIRRTALALLLRAPKVQGFYRSSQGTAFIARLIDLEEAHGREINAAQTPTNSVAAANPGLIPEEARIGPVAIFRPRDGLPAGTTEEDLPKWWNSNQDQMLLRLSRGQGDPVSGTWKLVHEYVPVEF